MQIDLRIETEEPRWDAAIPDIETVMQKVKTATFDYVAAHENIDVLSTDKPIIVNVCLSNDAHVWQLNRDFRNQDKPTNVLSFANIDFDDFNAQNEPFTEIELGDIIIAFETMEKEAQAENITLYAHFCHLLVHGFLHILGFDHIEDDEAEYMESFEKAILQSIGIANPYEES
ncbi:MAG: rRNA maturation RNase YbeY [Alphaproteobacteria bacterium]|nr:rRNA maturation RNase YbeY [Alphaproteobacteria bacterium]